MSPFRTILLFAALSLPGLLVIPYQQLQLVLAAASYRQIVQRLLDKLDESVRQKVLFYTNTLPAFVELLASNSHQVDKGNAFYIWGLFAGLRARCSRLVKRMLTFSKKVENLELA